MNKTILFLLIAFCLSTIKLKAQDLDKPYVQEEIQRHFIQFSILGGISIPASQFRKESGDYAGNATIGTGFSLQADMKLSNQLSWTTSFLYTTNGYDESQITSKYGNNISVKATKYKSTFVLTGLGYEANLTPEIIMYFQAQGGVLFSDYADVTISSGSAYYKETEPQSSALAFGFGAGLTRGILNFGFRYITSDPIYEFTTDDNGDIYMYDLRRRISVFSILFGITL